MEKAPHLEELSMDKEGNHTEVDGNQKISMESGEEETKSKEIIPETPQAEPKTLLENEKSPEEIVLPNKDPSMENSKSNPKSPSTKHLSEQQSDPSPKKEFDKNDIEAVKEMEDPNSQLDLSTKDKLCDSNSSFVFNYIDQDLSEASKKSNFKTQELDSLIKYYLKQDSRKNSDGIFIAPVHKLGSQNSRLNPQLPVNLNHSGEEEFLLSDPEYSLNSVILDSVRTRKLASGIHPETINASSSKHKARFCELWQNDKDRNKIIESLEKASQNYCKAMKTLEDLADRLKACES